MTSGAGPGIVPTLTGPIWCVRCRKSEASDAVARILPEMTVCERTAARHVSTQIANLSIGSRQNDRRRWQALAMSPRLKWTC